MAVLDVQAVPEMVKSGKQCMYRNDKSVCCNSQNYLRAYKCSDYCVVKLQKWIEQSYPQMSVSDIEHEIIKIAHLEEPRI